MAVETKINLSEETKTVLQELLQMNIDSRDGFRYAAQQTDNLTLISLFDKLASERDAQGQELSACLTINDEEPNRTGSFAASLHRSWMAVREAFTSNNEYTVLAEAERGEDTIKQAYEAALKDHPGTAMNDVLQRQYRQVKMAHDRVRDLRDARKED